MQKGVDQGQNALFWIWAVGGCIALVILKWEEHGAPFTLSEGIKVVLSLLAIVHSAVFAVIAVVLGLACALLAAIIP